MVNGTALRCITIVALTFSNQAAGSYGDGGDIDDSTDFADID